MRARSLGRTEVPVTALGFGAAQLGNLYAEIDDRTAAAAVAAAWDGGIRYFDTAPHYGLGLSERRLGAALAGYPREQFTLSTKVGRLLEPDPDGPESDLGIGGFAVSGKTRRRLDYSADGVRRSLTESLQRLGLDRIDIVYVHDPDDHLDQAIAEAIPALVELRDQGVIRAVGAGMNFVEPLRRIVRETDVDAVMVAGRWTLLDRSAQQLLDECAEREVAAVVAAPFNSGLLAKPRPTGGRFNYEPAAADLLAAANDFADLAERSGLLLPQLALQFGLQHPAVPTVVAGMGRPQHVLSNLERMADQVPQQVWDRLPGGVR